MLQHRPWTKHVQGCPPLRRCGFIKSTLLEGQAAPPPLWWCFVVVFVGCLCCVSWSHNWSYVGKYQEINLRRGYVGSHFVPNWLAPYLTNLPTNGLLTRKRHPQKARTLPTC